MQKLIANNLQYKNINYGFDLYLCYTTLNKGEFLVFNDNNKLSTKCITKSKISDEYVSISCDMDGLIMEGNINDVKSLSDNIYIVNLNTFRNIQGEFRDFDKFYIGGYLNLCYGYWNDFVRGLIVDFSLLPFDNGCFVYEVDGTPYKRCQLKSKISNKNVEFVADSECFFLIGIIEDCMSVVDDVQYIKLNDFNKVCGFFIYDLKKSFNGIDWFKNQDKLNEFLSNKFNVKPNQLFVDIKKTIKINVEKNHIFMMGMRDKIEVINNCDNYTVFILDEYSEKHKGFLQIKKIGNVFIYDLKQIKFYDTNLFMGVHTMNCSIKTEEKKCDCGCDIKEYFYDNNTETFYHIDYEKYK